MRLNVMVFALTCALFWGVGLFLITLWIILWDGSNSDPTFIGRVYRGYNLTVMGGLFGSMWAFADGLIGGAIFAWLYNLISRAPSTVVQAPPPAA